MQGDFLDQPLAYGSVKRDGDYRGRTLHHYVDDPRFNALGSAVEYGAAYRNLWEKPQRIIDSGVPSMCEVNFSTSNHEPRARAAWQIFKKRWLSRWFQENGIKIFADLNVAPVYQELNLSGIPLGYRAFSTKIHKSTSLQELTDQAGYAESIRGSDDLLLVIFSHRSEVRNLCMKEGWIYVDEGSSIWGKRVENKTRKLEALQSVNIDPTNYKQKTLMELI
jgi:hypothetical protein